MQWGEYKMNRSRSFRSVVAVVSCLSVAWPRVAAAESASTGSSPLAADTTRVTSIDDAPSAVAGDVALHAGGTLAGQIVSTVGRPLAGARLEIWQNGQPVGEATSGPSGYFAVRGLRGGTYEVAQRGTRRAYRLWAPGTAPPLARQQVLWVDPSEAVVRAQCPPCGNCGHCHECCGGGRFSRIGRVLRNPWVLAGLIGAAIAIPIGANNHNREPAS